MARPFSTENTFRGLGHRTRCRVIELLKQRDFTPTELVAALRVSKPTVSEHLRVLRTLGLIRFKRRSNHHVYQLDPRPIREAAAWLERVHQASNRTRAMTDRNQQQRTRGAGERRAKVSGE